MRSKFILLLFYFFATIAACITPRKGPRKALAKASSIIPFDAVIVPGIPFNGGNWDSIMKARVLWSFILYKNGYTKNIIYSGAAVYTPYYEARVMGLYGQALGIPAEHIFYDTCAKHSTENVYYSYLVAKRHGFKSIALATDPFQSFLLRRFTRRRFGTPIYHLPFIVDSLAAYNSANPVINPRFIKVKNWTPIYDQESFSRRFRGTMGRMIDWSRILTDGSDRCKGAGNIFFPVYWITFCFFIASMWPLKRACRIGSPYICVTPLKLHNHAFLFPKPAQHAAESQTDSNGPRLLKAVQ